MGIGTWATGHVDVTTEIAGYHGDTPCRAQFEHTICVTADGAEVLTTC